MINAIRADFYRLFRLKAFYITQIVMILFVVISIVTQTIGSNGVQTDELEQLESAVSSVPWTGSTVLPILASMASLLIYFCLPFFNVILCYDLTKQTYKNILTSGVSRNTFFFSKYTVFLLTTFFQLIFYYVLGFVTAVLKNGFGTLNAELLKNFFSAFGIQIISLQALFTLAAVVLMLSFSNIWPILVAVLSPILISLLILLTPAKRILRYLSFQTNIDNAWMKGTTNHYWLTAVCVEIIFSILCLAVAAFLLRKKDL